MLIPKWLRVQRLCLFVFFALGILLLAYALGFLTNAYIFFAFGDKALREFYNEMQGINTELLFKAVIAILIALALFMVQINKRAAGRYTLCIMVLICIVSLFISIDSIIKIAVLRHEYTLLDLSELDWYIERGTISYSYSTFVFDLGLIKYGLFAAAAVFMTAVVARNAVTVVDDYKKRVPSAGGKP